MTEKNEFKKIYKLDVPRPTRADILRAVEFSEAKKSLLLQLVGDTPKVRILDFLIANKGQSFSKTEISRGANVFKTAFFKQKQGKHYYDHFGELVRLGVVKAVNDGGRYPKYAIDSKVLKARLKEVSGE